MTAQVIDDVLVGSFPASDPPAWTSGIARPAPDRLARPVERPSAQDETTPVRTDVIDVSRPPGSERTWPQAVVSLIGAVGIALLVPLAIVAITSAVALAVSGVLELADRLLAILR